MKSFLIFLVSFLDSEAEYSSQVAQPRVSLVQRRRITVADSQRSGRRPAVRQEGIGRHSDAFTLCAGNITRQKELLLLIIFN